MNSSKKIAWITGAGGLIGYYFVQTAPQHAAEWHAQGLTRKNLDLLDFAAVRRAFREDKPQLIIHCAAMSKSPECQAKPELARKTNIESTALLAELAADIPFVFFSTDLVFDGRKGNYVESDSVSPLNVYAETKVAAERIVLANPRHTVIRTSLNGGTSPTGDRGFNEQMRRGWEAGATLKFFSDEFRCPIPAAATAHAVWELVRQKQTGMFHIAGNERLSREQIGRLLAARWGQLKPKFTVSSLKEYAGAPRSPDTSLDCSKAHAVLPFPLPGFTAWLATHPQEVF